MGTWCSSLISVAPASSFTILMICGLPAVLWVCSTIFLEPPLPFPPGPGVLWCGFWCSAGQTRKRPTTMGKYLGHASRRCRTSGDTTRCSTRINVASQFSRDFPVMFRSRLFSEALISAPSVSSPMCFYFCPVMLRAGICSLPFLPSCRGTVIRYSPLCSRIPLTRWCRVSASAFGLGVHRSVWPCPVWRADT